MPSFAIAAAFEGHEDLEENDGADEQLYGYEREADEVEDQEKALKDQFYRGMEKKKLWMQSLAAQKLYPAIIKCVADCYAPLYEAMDLEGRCPLLVVARDEAKESELETQYQPLRFDDLLTKTTEQEAMALLVIGKKPMLAMTIVEHRMKLAEELEKRATNGAGVVLPGADSKDDEDVVKLGIHFRGFYSWAMGAYSMAGKNYSGKLYEIYKLAQDGLVYPTANMNVQYTNALIREQRYDDVFEFCDLVRRDSLPVTVYFYRQMLVATASTRTVEHLQPILDDMRVKGFKLRAEDYLRAIRTYDDIYFFRDRQRPWAQRKQDLGNEKQSQMAPVDTYVSCLIRIRKQEETPEEFKELVDAAQNVLALFDTMVDVDGLAPRDEELFSRVITAAVIAQELDRVPELLALHAEHGKTRKPLNYVGVRMAVNALLLLEKPTEAWGLVREMCPELQPQQQSNVSNILEFLSIKDRGSEIIALMHELKEMGALDVFSNSVIKRVIPALCRSVDNLSDDELVKTMDQFESVFQLRSNAHNLQTFLRECCYHGRLAAAKTVLRKWTPVKGNKRPIRKGRLAAKLLGAVESAPRGEVDWKFMAEVIDAVDFYYVMTDEDLDAIVSAGLRTYAALGDTKGEQRLRGLAEKRHNQLHHKRNTRKSEAAFWRRGNIKPAPAKPKMINGVPVLSSST